MRSKMTGWVCLLAAVWANIHGSFLLGPAILFIYAIGEWLERSRPANAGIRFASACLASLLATFINPYGWQLHEHVLTYLQNDYLMDHISEFRSFSFHSPGAYYIELFLLTAILGILALLGWIGYRRVAAAWPRRLVLAISIVISIVFLFQLYWSLAPHP